MGIVLPLRVVRYLIAMLHERAFHCVAVERFNLGWLPLWCQQHSPNADESDRRRHINRIALVGSRTYDIAPTSAQVSHHKGNMVRRVSHTAAGDCNRHTAKMAVIAIWNQT
jgi:hypothetical protein